MLALLNLDFPLDERQGVEKERAEVGDAFFFEELHVTFRENHQVVVGEVDLEVLASYAVKCNDSDHSEREVTLQEVDGEELVVNLAYFAVDDSEFLDVETIVRDLVDRPSQVQ